MAVTDEISNDKRLYDLVSRAHKTIDDAVGPYGGEVDEEWSLDRDSYGRPVVRLDLSDYKGRVEARFTPDELDDADKARYRLRRAWGDLLQNRSHRLLDDLLRDDSEGNSNGP